MRALPASAQPCAEFNAAALSAIAQQRQIDGDRRRIMLEKVELEVGPDQLEGRDYSETKNQRSLLRSAYLGSCRRWRDWGHCGTVAVRDGCKTFPGCSPTISLLARLGTGVSRGYTVERT